MVFSLRPKRSACSRLRAPLLLLATVSSFASPAAAGAPLPRPDAERAARPTRVRETHLTISRGSLRVDGVESEAMLVDGGVPGPTLRWRVGDLARIHVTNEMEVDTSIHWHGLLLPNRQDGVPGLTTPGIRPGATHVFEIPIRHPGTYWYHSHTGLQEQRGVYGAIVIEPEVSPEPPVADRDVVLVLSDWTRRDPESIMRLLKRGSEYFSIEKGTAQSLWGALRAGELGSVFRRSLRRMPPMDISDVAYDAFLVNGVRTTHVAGRPGERLRVRVVNASASTYFHLDLGGRRLRVLAADGVDVEPVDLDRLLMAIAETYDLLVEVPASGRVELRATAQDGSGHASAWIGDAGGPAVPAPDVPRPNLYRMRHGDHAAHERPHRPHDDDDMPHGVHDDQADHADHDRPHTVHDDHAHSERSGMPDPQRAVPHRPPKGSGSERPPAPYAALRSKHDTRPPDGSPTRTIRLALTGNMDRYVWSFDGRTLDEADEIRIRRGEVLRIVLDNTTMMHHPLHLHGHFFRVLGPDAARAGDPSAPWKHTVDLPPMGSTTIEFLANAEGDWFFHCHVLYHMKSGMSRIFHYEGDDHDPALAAERARLFGDPWYAWANASVLSHFTEGLVTTSNRRNELAVDWEIGWQGLDDGEDVEAEGVARYRYHFSRLYRAFAGFHLESGREVGVFGAEANGPLGFGASAWVDTEGHGRFTVDQEVALTPRLSLVGDVEYDTQREWEGSAGLRYRVLRAGSLAFEWHSEFGFGAGLELIY